MAMSKSGAPAMTRASTDPRSGTSTCTSCSGIIFPLAEGWATACSVVTARPFPISTPVPKVMVSISSVPSGPGVEGGARPRTSMTVECSLSATAFQAAAGSEGMITAAGAAPAAIAIAMAGR